MHPAFSVIVFTTLTGSGYGVLAFLGLQSALGVAPFGRGATVALYAFALALTSVGLLSSLLHLGRPARAWRAFSQWRSSWLSREGIAALFTFLPALMALAFAWLQNHGATSRAIGVLLCASSLVTVACTAMIYASLPPIAAWRDRAVVPVYLAYTVLGGMLWSYAAGAWVGAGANLLGVATVAALAAMLAALKFDYWRRIDRDPMQPTTAAAIGLPHIGTVRSFERPHTESNYLLREMGHVLARRHAERLRQLAIGVGLVLPVLATGVAALAGMGRFEAVVLTLAAFAFQLGALVERWLFFAQARHSVTSYYGYADAARTGK
jgi:DMSO reductase anchor subunit